ncbi:MAG: MEDS domain-containing protein [Terriglobia bacterium]
MAATCARTLRNYEARISVAGQPPMSPPIFTHIDARFPVHCHEHVAVLHRGGAWAARGVEFVSEGLSRGHRCCYQAPTARHPAMLTRLGELGVDVERHRRDRTLQFPAEASSAGDWLDWAKVFFAEAEDARAAAVRWLEEGVGTKPADISLPQFFECHSYLNFLVKHYPGVALCHYDCEHLEIPHLFSAIAVHRHLLVESTLVRDNPFYVPAEKFVAMSPEDRERDLRDVFREVGFDLEKLFSTLAGYGQLQRPAPGS